MRQINALGYAAESAGDGLEALVKWKTGRYGLVITDCNMPHIDGYELARRIRAHEAETSERRVPIIACTANALRGEAEACFEAGMDDYLPKPVELTALQKKLHQWLPLPTPPDAVSAHDLDTFLGERAENIDAIDESVLAALTCDVGATEREILCDFERATDDDVAALTQALQIEDAAAVATLVHRMKGASRMVGMMGFAGVCDEIERAAQAGLLGLVREQIPAFHVELARVKSYIAAKCSAVTEV